MSPERVDTSLIDAVMNTGELVARLHAGDADLVRPGAEKHGVNVVEGDLFTAMSPGDYNPRLPEGSREEAEKLSKACRMLVVCEDYRQSADVAEDLGINPKQDAVFATAGGDTQPDQARFEADVNFLTAILRMNPSLKLILTHHIGVCGGANHYTSGEMAKIRAGEKGEEKEIEEMNRRGKQMYDAIIKEVPEATVKQYLVMVDVDNEYKGMIEVR